MTIASEWAGDSSIDHRATVLLRHEHALLLELFRRQHAPADAADGRALQERIIDLVELVGRMERDVLFPALPGRYAALVSAFEADHVAVAGCLAGLRNATDVLTQKACGERLEQLVRAHVAEEDTLLLGAVERDEPMLDAHLYEPLVGARRALARAAAEGARLPH